MAEFRLTVPDDFLAALKVKMGNARMTDIARDALTLFNWAVDEKTKGRLVLSSDGDGNRIKQLSMASLDQIAQRPSNP